MQLKVVFIDDEIELCELFKDLLESTEVHVTTFSNPLSAIEYILKNDIDIVFTDFRMPEMTGIEFQEKINQELPCYLVTGENDLTVPDSFIAKIDKPFDFELFDKIFQEFLVKKAG